MSLEWKRIILMALIVSISIYCIIMLVSFLFNYKKMLSKGLLILSILFIIFVIIFYYTRNSKNIIVTSLLNFTFIYPLGFMYSTEHILPSFDIKEILFFIIHYLFLPFSPFITLLASSVNLYPVKDGDTLSFL